MWTVFFVPKDHHCGTCNDQHWLIFVGDVPDSATATRVANELINEGFVWDAKAEKD